MIHRAMVLALVLCAAAGRGAAQERDLQAEEMRIRVKPASLTLVVGGTARLEAELVDIGGRPVKGGRIFFFSRARRSLRVDSRGNVTARKPGKFEIVARTFGGKRVSTTVPVTVLFPEAKSIGFIGAPKKVYAGTHVRLQTRVMGVGDVVRNDLVPVVEASDAKVASIDEHGFLSGLAPGACKLVATCGALEAEHAFEVVPNPVTRLEMDASSTRVRTGDVVKFTVRKHGNAADLSDVPVHYSFHAIPDDNLGQGASGQIEQDGRFVAETPGMYTVVATCGTGAARQTIRVTKRFKKKRRLKLVGQGKVFDTHTSDLWVWEGVDKRDYAVTGTWGANGEAHFWDVTNPSDIKRISTVRVDARTVNDVKVSEDGRICVISREGASNRKNGIVIYDVTDPRKPKLLSTYTEGLTGGVHNLYIYENHVYALSAGRWYDVINIEDPARPRKVGKYEVFKGGASIHDVWVEDGLAYSSNWRHGVHIVDVGNGIAGGSPAKPVKVGSYAYPSGWNHAAFPFKSKQTGKFYVIAGDEAFPYGLHIKDKPTRAAGWMHFIDFSDMKNPKEVARYEVPEAGTHNLWVKDDLLYAAYYNGGVRIVDISGDLMGDLYKQGREIATFVPGDKDGYIPNAPMVWGPQPHKGHIFFSDWNTGLWAMKLVPEPARP